MIAAGSLVLLDTSALIELVRQNAVGQRIEASLNLRASPHRPLVSVVTIGEALSLARQFAWGERKVASLRELFSNLVVVDLSRSGLTDRYADITDFAQRTGRALSDNDRWIAATASVAGATLVTTDRDFDPLDPGFITRVWVDPGADA